MGNASCDVFCNVQLQFEFSTLWKLQYRLSTRQREWFRIFHKTGSKIIYVPQSAK